MSSPRGTRNKRIILCSIAIVLFLIGVAYLALFGFAVHGGLADLLRGIGYVLFAPYWYALARLGNLDDRLAFTNVTRPWKICAYTGIAFLAAGLVIAIVGG